MSGGRATLGLKRGNVRAAQAGDLSAIDGGAMTFISTFAVECKHYKDLQLRNLLTGAKGGVVEFWKQSLTEAEDHGKCPFMVAKQNHLPVLLGLCAVGVSKLNAAGAVGVFPKHNLYLFHFEEFLTAHKFIKGRDNG